MVNAEDGIKFIKFEDLKNVRFLGCGAFGDVQLVEAPCGKHLWLDGLLVC